MNVLAAVQAAGEEMPRVLDVPIDEFIIGIIAFLIVFGTLSKFALPKIKATLEEYRSQLAQAREEAAGIRTQAQADRTAIIDEARNEARQAAAAVTAAAEAALAADRAQAMSTLTRQIGEISVTLAGKVVGEALTDDARVRATVDAFLDDLERQVARS
jgi:F-type H+-transporting ATPase subunit b